jgi:hypothetical protein
VAGRFPLTHHIQVVLDRTEKAVENISYFLVIIESRIKLLYSGQN